MRILGLVELKEHPPLPGDVLISWEDVDPAISLRETSEGYHFIGMAVISQLDGYPDDHGAKELQEFKII